MSDERALLAAIWEHPHEDTPRVAYADWLQETGQPDKVARAEFIRLQCELAHLDEDDPRTPALEKRAEALRKKHAGAWKAGLPGCVRSASYHRGFVRPKKTVRVCRWDREPAGEWAVAPLWEVHLTQHSHRAFAPIPDSPDLLRVGWLDLDEGEWRSRDLHPDDALALVRSPNARNLCSLDFAGARVGSAPVVALCEGNTLPALTCLRLPGVGAKADAVNALIDSKLAARLTELNLWASDAGPDALGRLLGSGPRFPRLRTLWVSPAYGTTDPIPFPVKCDPFPSLRELRVGGDRGTAATVAALARWPGLRTVRVLYAGVDYPGVDAAAARALAESPYLGQLRELRCYTTPQSRHEPDRILKDRFGNTYRGWW